MKDPFLSRERIDKVDEPLLVVHGTEDATIPFAQGQSLFDMANEPKQMRAVEGAGHSDLWIEGLWPTSLEFLARNGVADASFRQ